MTLNGHLTLNSLLCQYVELGRLWLSKTIACKLIKTDPHYQQRKCSAGTLVSGDAGICRRQMTAGSMVNTRAAHSYNLIVSAVYVTNQPVHRA